MRTQQVRQRQVRLQQVRPPQVRARQVRPWDEAMKIWKNMKCFFVNWGTLIFAILIIPTIIGAKVWDNDQSFLSGLGAFVVSTLFIVGSAAWCLIGEQQDRVSRKIAKGYAEPFYQSCYPEEIRIHHMVEVKTEPRYSSNCPTCGAGYGRKSFCEYCGTNREPLEDKRPISIYLQRGE